MSEKKCGMCQYYTVNPQNIAQGLCHRFPPTMLLIGMSQQGPMTQMYYGVVDGKNDWCGEFRPRLEMMS